MRVFQELEIRGGITACNRWLEAASQLSPGGWCRDGSGEVRLPYYRCFVRACSGDVPEVRLYLVDTSHGLRVANVVPADRSLGVVQYNQIVSEFHDLIAKPAASQAAVELRLSSDTFTLDQAFPPRVLRKLLDFSHAANKTTGAGHPSDRERWLEFVVSAHRAHVDVSESLLAQLLEEELGWLPDIASTLAGDYISALEVLQFNEALQATAA